MTYILLLILLFSAEIVYFRIADHFNIIDKPNERSSHTSITLRGGGIVFYIGVLMYFVLEGFQYPWFVYGLTLITVISFADDIKPQSFILRLLIHLTAMLFMFYQWQLFQYPWYFSILALIVCIGIINAYNFMDGINGITGVYSLVVLGALWYINSYSVHFVDNNLIYIVMFSLVVFNFFNFRKRAKCFAGDVGALSIAFLIVFLLGLLILKTHDFSYIILLVVYGIDSILTIVHRLILKENIFFPHRKHVYQIMANEMQIPHLIVSTFYALLQAVIAVGYFVFKMHSYYYLIGIILILSLCYVLFMKKYFQFHKDSRKWVVSSR